RVLLGSPFFLFVVFSCTGSEGGPAQNAQTVEVARTATAAQLAPISPTKTASIAAAQPVKPESKIKYAQVTIASSLEDAMIGIAGKEMGTLLSQISTRVLVWWIDVQKDFRKGDRLELVYEVGDPEPIIHAVWFQSEKL